MKRTKKPELYKKKNSLELIDGLESIRVELTAGNEATWLAS